MFMLLLYYIDTNIDYHRFSQVPYCFRSVTNIKPFYILQIVVDEKMEMVALIFKYILLMIRFFRKKDLPLLFKECLNVTIMVNVLNSMV